jgi:phage-related holin
MIGEHMIRAFENIGKSIDNPKGWILITSLFWFVNQYVFSQWSFALGFLMVFVIDTLTGSYCAFRRKKFSFLKFRQKLFEKSLAYFSIIVSYSIGTKIVLEDGSQSIIQYLNIPFYSLFFTVEFGSILKNWYEYKKWPWLRPLMKHFEGFDDKTGNELKDDQDEDKRIGDQDPT